MSNILRPLGKVREMVQSVGLDISYAYDDLVFSDHSVFILRFDDALPERLYLYFNSECNTKEAKEFEQKLKLAAKTVKLEIISAGKYTLEQNEEKEEIDIKFHESAN